MNLYGLDLSLSATGIAFTDGKTAHAWTQPASSKHGLERLIDLADAILMNLTCNDHPATIVAMEGPSLHSSGAFQHDRAGLWWMVRERLHRAQIWVAVVPPASLKKFATGKGNASKMNMLAAAIRRFPNVDVQNDNEADALWLAAAASQHYGRPLAQLPQEQVAALAKTAWPEVSW